MGTTEDSFHLLGSLPDIIDLLNNLVICGAMLYTVDLSIVAEIPSDPLALVVSSDNRRSKTSSSSQRNSSGQ